jgi:hypothetical protein
VVVPTYQRSKNDEREAAEPDAPASETRIPPAAVNVLALQRSAGNHAVTSMLMRDPQGGTVTPAGGEVTGTPELDISLKDDAVLARGIVDGELAILRQWRDALLMFDKTMSSESDKSGKPDFQKTVSTFFFETVVSSMFEITALPGLPKGVPQPGKTLYGLLQKLEAEHKRAKAAQASARLRDFFNTHLAEIAELDRQLALAKDDFEATATLAADKATESDQAASDYGMLRMKLVELFQSVEQRLNASDSSTLFTRLSEQWINASTVYAGMGQYVNAVVIIRLEEDYSLRNGHIQGGGGQKLAEQLLKNSPDGVDLWGLAVPRRVIRYAANGWPKDILQVDKNGRRQDTGAYAEGQPGRVWDWIQRNGIPKVKKVTGD